MATHAFPASFPVESAFIETFMRGLTLPAAGADGKVRCECFACSFCLIAACDFLFDFFILFLILISPLFDAV
jgi:hypothetical protein